MHQFTGSTIEEALQLATAELGREITVVRARRVTSRRALGMGSKVRFEVDVMAGTQADVTQAGPFDGVLANLIDNIERLEADQPSGRSGNGRDSGPGQPIAARTMPAGISGSSGFVTPAASRGGGFGDADLAPGPIGYGPGRRRNSEGGLSGGSAGEDRIDLRPTGHGAGAPRPRGMAPQSEVDDDVLAAMVDRPRGAHPTDATPARASLARTPAEDRDRRQPGDPAQPYRSPTEPTADGVTPGGEALARAARVAAERAAQHRAATNRDHSRLPDPLPSARFETSGNMGDAAIAEEVMAARLAAERTQVEAIAQRRREAERHRLEQSVPPREDVAVIAARIELERQTLLEAEVRRLAEERLVEERRAEEAAFRQRAEIERQELARLEVERLLADRRRAEADRLAQERAELERAEVERAELERGGVGAGGVERAEVERAELERGGVGAGGS